MKAELIPPIMKADRRVLEDYFPSGEAPNRFGFHDCCREGNVDPM